MDKKLLTSKIKRRALELGFAKVGITTADDFPEYEAELHYRPGYRPWINPDRSEDPERSYLIEGVRPRGIMPGAKSIVCAVYDYSRLAYPEELTASVARAYLSRAYVPLPDSICGLRARALHDYLTSLGCRVYDGDKELPQRLCCARAGVTTYGRNNFAYAEDCGSFVILYTYLTEAELEYDAPTVRCDCPSGCRKCVEACPTGALYAPGKLSPQRCLLYSHMRDSAVPADIMEANGTLIHGCDRCQTACPRNIPVMRRAAEKDPFLELLKREFDLEKILFMDDAYYERVVRPIMYNYIRKPEVFRRNAAIAIGNTNDAGYIPALKTAIERGEPIVREAAAWALERIGGGPR
ncbi:epoxyqueuosine reductase [Cloacibacillus porcorum]|uniref:epoxyqueuosine reductase n=1 Tax=Cloacibacillus porcorum TaxID=1197717 RepID=UPI0014591ED0|nr:4Fe-4S double cluster binding domain-containing protein [Cloacibacillus porcorum]MCC8185318.1 HEAT repeat domain-containing protein [Cloacibacillus porcorum]MDY5391350.1 4Fe-4S double cluster binding domain-containing protein [Cloacibacillus porcorum]NMF17078.1 epoxyqueuosine reductase [Cloacibacillus porcorum]